MIDVEFNILMQRLTGRRTCGSCGQMFNIHTSPPRIEGRCDKCGGGLEHRADDNEDTIGSRLRVYEDETAPLVDYFRKQKGFVSSTFYHSVNADQKEKYINIVVWDCYDSYLNVVNAGFSNKEGENTDRMKVLGRGFPEPIVVSPGQYEVIGN